MDLISDLEKGKYSNKNNFEKISAYQLEVQIFIIVTQSPI